MAATPHSDPKPSGEPHNPTGANPVVPSFEDNLHEFWQKNRTIVIGLFVLVILFIVGKGGWEYMQGKKEQEIQQAKAAANTPEKLRAFIAAHPSHTLAGVAEIEIGDEAYAAGKAADAIAAYDRGIAILKSGPVVARAQIGRALAKVQSGQTQNGVADLTQILNDAKLFNAARAEAAYHLATIAADAGNAADVQKHIEKLNQIDPSSIWARRAMALQASFPSPAAPTAPAAPAAAPAANEQKLKLPGK